MIIVYTDPRCLQHRAPAGYPEHPGRLEVVLEAVRARIRDDSRWRLVESCSHDAVLRLAAELHDPDYLERFQRAVARGDGLLDSSDNPLDAHTWDAAIAAAETTLTAADAALDAAALGVVGGAAAERQPVRFAAVRPPGHHAEHGTAMGFCYLANVAFAAQRWRQRGLERVAVLDFDVHHGNGTQHLFEDRGDVLFLSTHQSPFYPGTGAASERGVGNGLGATVNVPLAAGTGPEALDEAWDSVLLPALESFQPQGLLVSAGFDAWKDDPLGGLQWQYETFASLGSRLTTFAAEQCAGRMVSVLEGGYDVSSLGELVCAYLEGCNR